MNQINDEQGRSRRFLNSVLNGNRYVRTEHDTDILIKAICGQHDRLQCLVSLCSKDAGIDAVRKAACIDTSLSALNGKIADLILYFAGEELRHVSNGNLIRTLLTAIIEPPLLWNAYKTSFDLRQLANRGLHAFGSLVMEAMALLTPASPLAVELDVKSTARAILESRQMHQAESLEVRQMVYKIEDGVQKSSFSANMPDVTKLGPGGRHDNDFVDFRKISIYPTKDELLCQELPYLMTVSDVMVTEPEDRVAAHLGNQYRLSREDMLAELREDLKLAQSRLYSKSSRGRTMCIRNLQFSGINCDSGGMYRLNNPGRGPARKPIPRPAAFAMRCFDSIFTKAPEDFVSRRKYFQDDRAILKHGSFGCVLAKGEFVACATVDRDEEMLAMVPSSILLRVLGNAGIRAMLMAVTATQPQELEFLMVGTAYFAYEPILQRLKSMPSLPLADTILDLGTHDTITESSPYRLESLAEEVLFLEGQDIGPLIGVTKEIRLDAVQSDSLAAGLTHRVAQIVGPPGTGKSFIGSILTKLLMDHVPNTTILVLCYTNHALDQFLEDLLDMGVAQDQILRLGAKCTVRTGSMRLSEQDKNRTRPSGIEYRISQLAQSRAVASARTVSRKAYNFRTRKLSDQYLYEYLEFSEHESHFYNALKVPQHEEDMVLVGSDGKAIDELYLFQRWRQGKDKGIFEEVVGRAHDAVWQMQGSERKDAINRWAKEAMSQMIDDLADDISEYEASYAEWASTRENKIAELMNTKRIIGCTTTAAAKYAEALSSVKAGIVLVEEAGEVLESHILTALSPQTKQLIMIGDHRQLRPKVKNYALTVEKGDGFDLNRSLFERLIISDHPHTTLQMQHRMRPQISALVRRLMYSDLKDGENVLSRPDMLGLQGNVIFIDHNHPEEDDKKLREQRDGGSTVSRQNVFEAEMVLKIVKYLAQQGYGTDKQVVLTPYLGQLRLLLDKLKKHHDPILSDLDNHDLIRAGLLSQAGADATKRSLRLSTIDNFQGEESDVVIVSLTRGNSKGDIGFMNAPERLNVLLSRARVGLIIIGNSDTFKRSKSSVQLWTPFFEQLVDTGSFYKGLPIKCETHPARTAVAETPDDFGKYCPNGGCDKPCGTVLACGKHKCPELCHQLVDHSKQKCSQTISQTCKNKHTVRIPCFESLLQCPKCRRDIVLQRKREEKQEEYLRKLIALDDDIQRQVSRCEDVDVEQERARKLERKQEELTRAMHKADLKESHQRKAKDKVPSVDNHEDANSWIPEDHSVSDARKAWNRQKDIGDPGNEHIDAIMDMIGLEAVKNQVLSVKDLVDTKLRQECDLDKERFNVLLLGNPGTGKTTVARHYAKSLASMGVVSGSAVEETTASKLMYMGVAGYKQVIDKILEKDGGALFVDEAYQLTSGSTASGSQILDAIMDDAENLTGKVVFILAGYRREMETLLAHNPGLQSRFPQELSFDDYDDSELALILRQKINQRFKGRMNVEGGLDGLYVRIMARRVGYGRGRPGFGNARAIENTLKRVMTRQAARVSAVRRDGKDCDDFLLTQGDMLGPEPSNALQASKAWIRLQSLIGLESVKQSVHALMHSLKSNYERELKEEPPLQFNLNRIFLGSPGTGKTTVAKLYGEILADLGLLSNGEVMLKNPSDFIGDVLGASEKATKGILAAAAGKVLVIDEAYGLGGGSGQATDIYKTAVIDTLVAEVQSVPGDDRCVLLLGYQEQMESMLRTANPGLERRFPICEAFIFEDFTDEQLAEVVKLKLTQQGYKASPAALQCIMECLQRARNKPQFGNAGEIDILLNTAKRRHQQRLLSDSTTLRDTLDAIDFDPDFDRGDGKLFSISDMFKDTIGQEPLAEQLEQTQRMVITMRIRSLDPREHVPYNFTFSGPPGTGKTTTARKMGKIYYNLGILATSEVLERSASDLVGSYVGQTAGKTKSLLESALGKVLFIDEAYSLGSGPFAREAIDELVASLTKPQFSRRLIVILAGYDKDIELLMNTNPGLTSRFPKRLLFPNLQAKACAKLLVSLLGRELYLDIAAIHSLDESRDVIDAFDTLINLGNWANARDVETLSREICSDMLRNAGEDDTALLQVTKDHAMIAILEMTRDRQKRALLLKPAQLVELPLPHQPQYAYPSCPPTKQVCSTATTISAEVPKSESEDLTEKHLRILLASGAQRDEGVTDDVWEALQADKQKAEERERACAELTAEVERLDHQQGSNDEELDSSGDEKEEDQARLALRLRREQDRIRYAELRREKERMEEERREEQRVQQKLRQMGVCPQGFQWTRQGDGYRCAGGMHFMSYAALPG